MLPFTHLPRHPFTMVPLPLFIPLTFTLNIIFMLTPLPLFLPHYPYSNPLLLPLYAPLNFITTLTSLPHFLFSLPPSSFFLTPYTSYSLHLHPYKHTYRYLYHRTPLPIYPLLPFLHHYIHLLTFIHIFTIILTLFLTSLPLTHTLFQLIFLFHFPYPYRFSHSSFPLNLILISLPLPLHLHSRPCPLAIHTFILFPYILIFNLTFILTHNYSHSDH